MSVKFFGRTRARSQALQLLFQAEATNRSVLEVLDGDSQRIRDRLATASRQNPNKFMTNRGPLIKLVTNSKHEEVQ